MKDSRVLYKEIKGCDDCPYLQLDTWDDKGLYYTTCLYDDREIVDDCYDIIGLFRGCHLPLLKDIERYLRYIRKDGSIECCGNCRNWEYKGYNVKSKKDKGYCRLHNICISCDSYSLLCFQSV